MNNLERQKLLDEEKYFKSIEQQRDMSGKMEYCMACVCCNHLKCECTINQADREKLSQCAKSYNIFKRKNSREFMNNKNLEKIN